MAKTTSSKQTTVSDTAGKGTTDDSFRHIVRIANTDLKGEKPLFLALQKIKGVGENFARILCIISGYDTMTRTGDLSEQQASDIEAVLSNPSSYNIPEWVFNARREYESGDMLHLFHSDLDYKQDQDIKRKKKMKSYVGLRHQWRLPVRGQRTQSHFRPNGGKGSATKKRSTIRK